ncbi:MAG: multidrug efflux system [Chlamydiota bacterium]|jgi:membrane fusion protein (multidrug efflux system)
MTESPKKRSHAMLITCAVFLFLGAAWGVYWFAYGQYHEYTDDAYVDGNQIMVTTQVPGIVLSFSAYDGDFVEKGRILVELDKTDALIQLQRAKAELGDTLRQVAALFDNVERDAAYVEVRQAEFVKAAQDYEHRKAVIEEGGVSLEDFEHAVAALHAAFFALQASEFQYAASVAAVENSTLLTHPLVEKAKSHLKEALVFYFRCTIRAPAAGIVGQRTVQVGERIPLSKPLLAIIPLDQLWITANYKEVQLTHMRIGQPVEVTCDTYGSSILFQGTVEGIGGATGSVFSVLPPQNATGNWIKIVQRVPVRIAVDQAMVKRYPLRMGLSVETTTDTHNRLGRYVPLSRSESPLQATDIFENEEEGIQQLIEEVIRANLGEMLPNA